MKTTVYLVRHAATAANLAVPAKLQGRRTDPPLHPFGVRQAQATRGLLAPLDFVAVYSSPLRRAMETARIISPGIQPQAIEQLTECDVGRWEGIDWDTIRRDEPDEYARYMADPAVVSYPGGESFAHVHARASAALAELMTRHADQSILVISHHVVNRTLLAVFLGLPINKARAVSLDNCGVSIVVQDDNRVTVKTLNSTLHLLGR